MPKIIAAMLMLATVAVLTTGKATAGPPEGASGKMVLDEVADGLRRYRKETDVSKRLEWLRRLAPSGDVRVLVALCEALEDATDDRFVSEAKGLIVDHYFHPSRRRRGILADLDIMWGWESCKDDMRRRAAQLPK